MPRPMSSSASLVRSEALAALGPHADRLRGLQGARLLVTGGTGFVGTWLAWTVSVLNDEYGLGIDLRLLSPNATAFATRVPELADRPDVTLVERDVRDLGELSAEVTHVIHAAGTPDSRVHVSDPVRTMSVIADGSKAVLEAVSSLPELRSVLMLSSGLVYGDLPPSLERVPETYRSGPECNTIASVYAESKRFAETLSAAYVSQYKLPLVTARPFAFIGPYQLLDKPWAINNFIRDAIHGGPIRILGNPETVRSYMYPADLAVWLLSLLTSGVPGTVYNVGSPNSVTLRELAEAIAGQFAESPEIVWRPVGDQKASRFVPDVTRAASLGLDLTVDLDEALARTIAWHSARAGS